MVAREMLAQAEHDPRAAVVVLATSASVAGAIASAVDTLLPLESRREIIAAALGRHGAVLFASPEEAIAFSNAWAPEHLWIAVANPRALARRVRSAGSVFLGASTSVTFGDYLTGANHVLPTEVSAVTARDFRPRTSCDGRPTRRSRPRPRAPSVAT